MDSDGVADLDEYRSIKKLKELRNGECSDFQGFVDNLINVLEYQANMRVSQVRWLDSLGLIDPRKRGEE